MKLLFLSARRP